MAPVKDSVEEGSKKVGSRGQKVEGGDTCPSKERLRPSSVSKAGESKVALEEGRKVTIGRSSEGQRPRRSIAVTDAAAADDTIGAAECSRTE